MNKPRSVGVARRGMASRCHGLEAEGATPFARLKVTGWLTAPWEARKCTEATAQTGRADRVRAGSAIVLSS